MTFGVIICLSVEDRAKTNVLAQNTLFAYLMINSYRQI